MELHQFQPDDDRHVVINTNLAPWLSGHGELMVMPIHEHRGEHVALVRWPANEVFQSHTHVSSEKIYVISGEFIDEHSRYPAESWIRSLHMSQHHPRVERGTLIRVKTGHLA